MAAVPGATITAPASGAVYGVGQSVSTSFSCVDGAGGPGITSCLDQSGGGSGGQLDTSTPGQHTYAVIATSLDGFTQDASVSYTVAAVPGATITAPASGAVYGVGQSVSTSFSCVDGAGGPGITSCLDQSGGGSGGQLDTSTPGQHTYAVIATSLDGFTQDASVSYTVAAVPGATITAPASGAVYGVGQSVSTSFSCVDGAGGPGITSCLDQSGGGSGFSWIPRLRVSIRMR